MTVLRRLYFLLLLTLAVVATACTDEYNLVIASQKPTIVVSGEITDEGGPFFIRLHVPTDYNAYSLRSFLPEPISKAQVEIVDNFNNKFALAEQPYGVYKTSEEFRPIPGRSYAIKIKTDKGETYESSPELLKQAPRIDSLYSTFNKAKKVDDLAWTVNAIFTDRSTANDFYVWKFKGIYEIYTKCPNVQFPPCFYQTTCWRVVESTKVNLLSDKLVNGRRITQPITTVPGSYYSPYTLEVAQQTLSAQAFRYWQQVQDQSANTGSIFDKLPAQVVGNIKCTSDPTKEALGYFFVKGSTRRTIRISRFSEQEIQRRVPWFDLNNPVRVGDCRDRGAFRDNDNVLFEYPSGWTR